MEIIAHIKTDFPTKFGVPRQSGLVNSLEAKIIFEPKFRAPDFVKELDKFSHVWLLWLFSEAAYDDNTATVRPPRLGGNKRVGVFASRSPFRPNSIGLSAVKLVKVEFDTKLGAVLYVSGADMMDNTPIIDIKPYLPFADSIPNAVGGYADGVKEYALKVEFSNELLEILPQKYRAMIIDVLAEDPRPSYQDDPDRIYGFIFADFEIKFKVNAGVLTFVSVTAL